MPRPGTLVSAIAGLSALAALGPAGLARAHIAMSYPTPRTTLQKAGPCGEAGSTRGETVAVFEPGETIVVQWTETVDHTSHYRIAFDVDGEDDFVPPAGPDDLYNSPAVLVDGIEDRARGNYMQAVTLPDVECERCTLQLIQMMHGSGNYFQCADIAIRRTGPAPSPVPSPDDAAVPLDDAGVPGFPGDDAGVPSAPPPTGGAGAPRSDGTLTLVGTCSAAPGSAPLAPPLAVAFAAMGITLVRRRRRSVRMIRARG